MMGSSPQECYQLRILNWTNFLSPRVFLCNVEKRKGLLLQIDSVLNLPGNSTITGQVLLNIEPKPGLPKEQKLLIIAQPSKIVS